MSQAFVVSGARLTHRSATLDQLEAATHADPAARLDELLDRDAVSEAAVLQTCNRVEEYVVADTAEGGRDALADAGGAVPDAVVVETEHEESLRHLLRVAAGLESQVLGEDQIIGQVRRAYTAAEDAGALGPVLEDALLKAIHVGERARTETEINEGTVSLGSAAVDLVERERGLDGHVVLVGAGETARTVASALADRGIDDVRLLNRTPERARMLASACDLSADCDGLDALPAVLGEADAVLTATGSDEPLIDESTLPDATDLLIVDLAQPRDVAPGVVDRDDVTVHDLEGLREVTELTHERRHEAAVEVEAIVEEEFDLLLDQYKRKRADAVIAAMYRGAERIKRRELAEARAKLGGEDLTEEEREVVEGLADAIVSQLMAVPTASLRDAAAEDDWETIATAIELFDPGLGEDAPDLFAAIADGTVDGSVPDAVEGSPAEVSDES